MSVPQNIVRMLAQSTVKTIAMTVMLDTTIANDDHSACYLVHVSNPGLLHSLAALGVGHEAQQVLLEDILAGPVKAAVVLPRLLEVVLLLNALLDSGT